MKEVLFGTMEGESRRGRPCRERLDDIKEWGGEEIHIGYSTETRRITARRRAVGTWRTVVRTALALSPRSNGRMNGPIVPY